MNRLSAILMLLNAVLVINSASAQNRIVGNRDMKVASFEELTYPVLGVTARIEGLVVVQVKLDDDGKVVDAVALSGNDILVPDALTNVKKWHFYRSTQKTVVVVYDFTLEDECYKPDSFTLKPNNLVVITSHRLPIH